MDIIFILKVVTKKRKNVLDTWLRRGHSAFMALSVLFNNKAFVRGVVAFDMEGIQYRIFAVHERKN